MPKNRKLYKESLRIYWGFAKQTRSLLVKSLFVIPGSLLINVVSPVIVARMAAELFRGGDVDIQRIGLYLAALLGSLLAGALCHQIYLINHNRMLLYVMKECEMYVLEHLMKQSYAFHSNSFAGALVAKSTRFSRAVISIGDAIVMQGADRAVALIAGIVVIYFYSKQVSIAMLVLTFTFILIAWALSKRRWPHRVRATQAESDQTAVLADNISNIVTVKTFSAERHELAAFAKVAEQKRHFMEKSWVMGTNHSSAILVMSAFLQFVVFGITAGAIQSGSMDIASLIVVQAYVLSVIATLSSVGQITKQFEQGLTDAEEMTAILTEDEDVRDRPHARTFRPALGRIEFKTVGFQYKENKQQKLFENFTLDIAPGEKIGLVGHSGSGKTTLTKLLLRFMDIVDGQILLDGVDITDIKQVSVRKAIAYVPQEPLMFHRSIMDNIRYGRLNATDEDVFEAARLAHAAEFIERLPDGYDTLVGERGMKLSGGQRQRVAIARAILKDAPIIVLDEATSALDSKSEKLIQDALESLMEKRTAIVIAHRLSTIQKMDRIVLLEDGQIKEVGSHKELLKIGGEYAKLWKQQSGGFLPK